MKVGSDGVLLGAWTPVVGKKRVLDVGTGTGLIALMLAQRCDAAVAGIDVDKEAVVQAKENVNASPWARRIDIFECSFQELPFRSDDLFDLIVSNPPYFINSLKAPSQKRNAARHTDSLTHEELILTGKKLLTETGSICLILPVNEGLICREFALSNGFYCSRMVWVKPKPDAMPKRLLFEFVLNDCELIESELTIETDQRHQYSDEFASLVRDFYLKL